MRTKFRRVRADCVRCCQQYVTQDQDHFDNTNENTWQQAYYVNDTFWVPGSDAPVFVCVGGEGPALTGAAVVDSEHCSVASQWLSETKALMFAVEHRVRLSPPLSVVSCADLMEPSVCARVWTGLRSTTVRTLTSMLLAVPMPHAYSPAVPPHPYVLHSLLPSHPHVLHSLLPHAHDIPVLMHHSSSV